jgi:hypothetical protein
MVSAAMPLLPGVPDPLGERIDTGRFIHGWQPVGLQSVADDRLVMVGILGHLGDREALADALPVPP